MSQKSDGYFSTRMETKCRTGQIIVGGVFFFGLILSCFEDVKILILEKCDWRI